MSCTKFRAVASLCATVATLMLCMSSASAASVSYTYDALGRVVKVTHAGGATETYTYDAAGNRTKVVKAS